MNLQIKNFTDKMIVQLRDEVEQSALGGYRFEDLAKRVETRYGVAQNKARFIAQQETSLFLAKQRESRFSEVGCVEYIWSGVGDERERHDHKALNGRRFRYDDPPVVDVRTGRKANPGQDFGCRCADRPILPGAKIKEAA